jgi:cytidyltransferase-like protein
MPQHKKVLTSDEAINISKGEDIVFASGMFDIIHFGHISFLREAKKIVGESGKLLVTTFTDKIINKYKGDNRPIMNQFERIEILSELESVDMVVVWEGWENIVEFVVELKPKFFAITEKSYDHSKNNSWSGQTWDEVARKINTKIIKIPIEPQLSSGKYAHLFE